MSLPARIAARWRWLCAGETLPQEPPAAPRGPGLRAFFLAADRLPPAPGAAEPDRRPPFLAWLLTPETLPRAEAAPPGAPRAGDRRPPRAES